jgi:hypothetical protein
MDPFASISFKLYGITESGGQQAMESSNVTRETARGGKNPVKGETRDGAKA